MHAVTDATAERDWLWTADDDRRPGLFTTARLLGLVLPVLLPLGLLLWAAGRGATRDTGRHLTVGALGGIVIAIGCIPLALAS